MIEPEIGQLLLQLTLAVDGAQSLGLLELAERFLRQFAGPRTHPLRGMGLRVHLLSILVHADSHLLGGSLGLRILCQQRLCIQIRGGNFCQASF